MWAAVFAVRRGCRWPEFLLRLALLLGFTRIDAVAVGFIGACDGLTDPLIGAAGTWAFPVFARVVQRVGQNCNKKNYLLIRAMGANAGGQIGSVMAAAVMPSVLKGRVII